MKPTQKKKSHRVERMNDLFREAIASYLISGLKYKNHETDQFETGLVTITRVKTSGDLQLARVYFTSLGAAGKATKAEAEKAVKAMRGASKEIRYHLAHELDLRRTPELEFFYDTELEEAYHLEKVLYDLEQEKLKSEKKKVESSDND